MTRMLLLQGRILPLIYWLPYFFCSQSEPRHPSCLQLTPSLVSTIPLTIPSEPRSNCVLVYWFTKILTSHHRSETLINIPCHWLYSLVYIIYYYIYGSLVLVYIINWYTRTEPKIQWSVNYSTLHPILTWFQMVHLVKFILLS